MISANITTFASTRDSKIIYVKNKLAAVESNSNVKVGVYAIDTNSNQIISYRANTLFPIQSTFKVIGVATLLK